MRRDGGERRLAGIRLGRDRVTSFGSRHRWRPLSRTMMRTWKRPAYGSGVTRIASSARHVSCDCGGSAPSTAKPTLPRIGEVRPYATSPAQMRPTSMNGATENAARLRTRPT